MNFTEYEQKLLDTKPKFLSDKEKRIRKNCKAKIHYQKNKDKIKEKIKKYKQENKEKIRESQKEYYEEYYEENKDKIRESYKKYYEENKDKILENQKEYYKSPEIKKNKLKNTWKTRGLNMENFEEIYKRYCKTTNCDNCGVLLTKHRKNNNTFKVMDHDHQTGEFRNVLCHLCNTRRR